MRWRLSVVALTSLTFLIADPSRNLPLREVFWLIGHLEALVELVV